MWNFFTSINNKNAMLLSNSIKEKSRWIKNSYAIKFNQFPQKLKKQKKTNSKLKTPLEVNFNVKQERKIMR